MHIPAELQAAIEDEVSLSRGLGDATQLLSMGYRGGTGKGFVNAAQRAAYLATRMPATYAAAHRVLKELAESDIAPESVLDLGAGPGTACWAAASVFPTLAGISMSEQDAEMSRISARLASASGFPALRDATHVCRRLPGTEPLPASDLVICSYFLGELDTEDAIKLALRAWEATSKSLVIIEPGSQRGFLLIKALRSLLLKNGAHLLAPCPHSSPCPLPDDDWCHFAARLERSSMHRRLKKGLLSYEDEKYSYLIFSREPKPSALSRIIRRPETGAGFVRLTLCCEKEIKLVTCYKRDKTTFRAARKAQWGDNWT